MFKSATLASLAATSLAVNVTSKSAAAKTRDCTQDMTYAINSDFDSGKKIFHLSMLAMIEEGCVDFPSFCTKQSFVSNRYHPLMAISQIGYTDVAE